MAVAAVHTERTAEEDHEVGDRFVAAADTSHQPIASPGCIILSVTYIHDKILVSNIY